MRLKIHRYLLDLILSKMLNQLRQLLFIVHEQEIDFIERLEWLNFIWWCYFDFNRPFLNLSALLLDFSFVWIWMLLHVIILDFVVAVLEYCLRFRFLILLEVLEPLGNWSNTIWLLGKLRNKLLITIVDGLPPGMLRLPHRIITPQCKLILLCLLCNHILALLILPPPFFELIHLLVHIFYKIVVDDLHVLLVNAVYLLLCFDDLLVLLFLR